MGNGPGVSGCAWPRSVALWTCSLPAREEQEHDRGTEGGSGPAGGRALLRAARVVGRRRGRLLGGGIAAGDQRGSAPQLEAGRRDAGPHHRRRYPGVGHGGVLLWVKRFVRGRFANLPYSGTVVSGRLGGTGLSLVGCVPCTEGLHR